MNLVPRLLCIGSGERGFSVFISIHSGCSSVGAFSPTHWAVEGLSYLQVFMFMLEF